MLLRAETLAKSVDDESDASEEESAATTPILAPEDLDVPAILSDVELMDDFPAHLGFQAEEPLPECVESDPADQLDQPQAEPDNEVSKEVNLFQISRNRKLTDQN